MVVIVVVVGVVENVENSKKSDFIRLLALFFIHILRRKECGYFSFLFSTGLSTLNQHSNNPHFSTYQQIYAKNQTPLISLISLFTSAS